MFIRILRPEDQCERLLNVNHISSIEVRYGIARDGKLWRTTLETAYQNPNAIRLYRFDVGGETYMLASDPGDPVCKVFDEIYSKAIKGPVQPPPELEEGR